jgi:hypothetical protein
MKTILSSSNSAARQNRMVSVSLANRPDAAGSRVLMPTPAAGEVLLVGLVMLLGLFLGAAANRAHAAEPFPAADAGDLILKSHTHMGSAPSFEIEQTRVDQITRLQAGQPVGPAATQTQKSIIRVVNGNPMVVEMITTEAGRPLRAIRRGDQLVIQIGSGPWQVPSGPYAQMKDQLATPYACPLPGRGKDSPQWQMAGTAREQDAECDIVETVGDSAVAYVTGIMNKSMTATASAGAPHPSMHVLSYQVRQWLARPDFRKLRAEQTAHMQATMRPPTGASMQVDMATTTTTVYRHYGEVMIDIPAEAEQLLAAPAPQS